MACLLYGSLDKNLNLFINIAVSPIVNIIFYYFIEKAKNKNIEKEKYSFISKKLVADVLSSINKKDISDEDRLLFKWVPRQEYITRIILNKLSNRISNHFTNKIFFNKNKIAAHSKNCLISRRDFRRFLVNNSDTVEQKITAKKYNEIKFDKISSLSIKRHWTHFNNSMKAEIQKYIQDLKEGKSKINATGLKPDQKAIPIHALKHVAIDVLRAKCQVVW